MTIESSHWGRECTEALLPCFAAGKSGVGNSPLEDRVVDLTDQKEFEKPENGDRARYFKWIIGMIFLVSGAALATYTPSASDPALFFTGVGSVIAGTLWFLVVIVQNQRSHDKLPGVEI